jgi:uncharacterized membrane protein/predicted DsbA family dithiol-disulfide isomerase
MSSALHNNLLSVMRVLLLVALTFSSALFVHYLDPANSGYCSGRSGCEAVRRSAYSYFLGQTWLNLPFIGVVSFSALLTLSFVPMDRRVRVPLLASLSVLGAIAAVVLIALQEFVIGARCWLCMVVDIAAVLAGVVGVVWYRNREVVQSEPLRTWSAALICLLLALSPIALWQTRPLPPLPEGVAALYQPGKINVVEFADFECPYCRTMHHIFKRLEREYGGRVNFHQLNMPLPGHRHALKAALAAVCAEDQGQGKAMKDRLFTSALDDDAPLEHAAAIGLNRTTFADCIDSAKALHEVEAHKKILMDAGFRGLPTTFVGNQRLVGWRPYAAMQEAYEAALAGSAGPWFALPSWLFATLAAALVVGIGYAGRSVRNGVARD